MPNNKQQKKENDKRLLHIPLSDHVMVSQYKQYLKKGKLNSNIKKKEMMVWYPG